MADLIFTYLNGSGDRVYFTGDSPDTELTLGAPLWVTLDTPATLAVTVLADAGAAKLAEPKATAQEIT